MKILRRVLCVILIFIMLFSFSACKNLNNVLDFSYFNTSIHVQTSKNISNDTKNKIENLFSSLENEFDFQNPNSIVYKFNNGKANEVFSFSAHAKAVFLMVKEAYEFTDGYFEPTIYPLVKLWGFAPYKNTISYIPPTSEQIESNLELINFHSLSFDFTLNTLTKLDQNVKLDLGGIVKGYSAEKCAEILLNAGHTDGYINVGGSSLKLLSTSSLGIRHPRKPNANQIISVNCQNELNLSVSTSGDYEKYYLDSSSNKYCHIINPKTGYPTNTGVASVTLIGIDGAIADALTTACCIKTHNISEPQNSELITFLNKIINKYPTCEVYAVYENAENKQIITNKTAGVDFTLIDSEYAVINI